MTKPTPTSVSFVADVHIGNHGRFGGAVVNGVNARGSHTLSALRYAVDAALDMADARNVDSAFVMLGDVFHYSRPEPALIAGTQNILKDHPQVIAITGNHDQDSGGLDDNAVSTLRPVCQVVQAVDRYKVKKITGFGELILVPFANMEPTGQIAAILCALPPPVEGENRVLCLHMGISDSATPYYLDATFGAINVEKLGNLCAMYGVTHVVAGDWHRHQYWEHKGVKIYQVGTLCPSRFPPAYEHGSIGPMVTIHSDGSCDVTNIEGPRFYKFTGIPTQWPIPDAVGCPVYVKFTVDPEVAPIVKEWCSEHEDELAGHEVSIKREQVAKEAEAEHEAVVEARVADNVPDAVRAYIEAMPIPDGVSREAVLVSTLRFLTNV